MQQRMLLCTLAAWAAVVRRHMFVAVTAEMNMAQRHYALRAASPRLFQAEHVCGEQEPATLPRQEHLGMQGQVRQGIWLGRGLRLRRRLHG